MSCIKTHNGWVQLEPEDYTLAQDVYVGVPLKQAIAENAVRVNRFVTSTSKWMANQLDYERIHDVFAEPIPEPITNPSPKYVMPYEGYKGPVRKGIEV